MRFSGLSDDLDIWLMPSGYVLLGVPESVRLFRRTSQLGSSQ